MSDCIFCRIASGEIPAAIVAETDRFLAFRDINAQAPIHVLAIPRVHVASLAEADDAVMLGELLHFARGVAEAEGLVQAGYRVVVNCGADGGQTVPHLHLHVMGGRYLGWPPG